MTFRRAHAAPLPAQAQWSACAPTSLKHMRAHTPLPPPCTCGTCRQKSVDIEVDLWRFEVPHAELQEAEEDSA